MFLDAIFINFEVIFLVYIKSNPTQISLLPTDLRHIIPKDHICYLIESVINQLDYDFFDEKVAGAGNPSYHPRILLKIIVQGVCDRVTSSRRLEKLTTESVIFRYLSENLHPNFHTISMFRKDNSEIIKSCFLETIEVAKRMDLINLNKLYLDGTKIKANASKSRNFSKEELDFLDDYLDKQLDNMDKTDLEEDKEFGNSDGEPKIPPHLTKKSKLREKVKDMLKDIRKSKTQIKFAKEKINSEKVKEVNLTDMDSKIMKMKKGRYFEQAYNCQLLVEDKSELIVCNNISNSPTDVGETIPTMEKFKDEQKRDIKNLEICQDNGYSSPNTSEYYNKEKVIAYIPDQLTTKELHGKNRKISRFDIDNFELNLQKNQVICPEGKIMNFHRKKIIRRNGKEKWTNVYRTNKCKDCKFRQKCISKGCGKNYRFAEINPHMRQIRLRFKTKEGIETYNKRFHKGEVAQAHILYNLGYREFSSRGMKNCENQLNLVSIAYNLKKIQIKMNKVISNLTQKIEVVINWMIIELNSDKL